MAFMEKQEYSGAYWTLETTHGTWFVPDEFGMPDEWEDYACADHAGTIAARPEDNNDADTGTWDSIRSFFGDYCEGGADSIETIERRAGKLYRLSAPGYMDCTEWTTDPDSPEFDEE